MLAAILESLGGGTLHLWLPNAALILTPVASAMMVAALGLKELSRPLRGCRQCGYDLRASPHQCPECGAPVV